MSEAGWLRVLHLNRPVRELVVIPEDSPRVSSLHVDRLSDERQNLTCGQDAAWQVGDRQATAVRRRSRVPPGMFNGRLWAGLTARRCGHERRRSRRVWQRTLLTDREWLPRATIGYSGTTALPPLKP